MQLDAPEHRPDGDRLKGSQQSEVPEPLGKASPAEEADESGSARVAWLKDSAGCGEGQNWRQGFQQSKQAEEGVARESCGGDSTAQASKAWRSLVTLATLQGSPLSWFEEKTQCGFLRQATSLWPCGGRGAGYPELSETEPGWEQLMSRGLCSPSWREGAYHLRVRDKACRLSNLPFPTLFSFLPPPLLAANHCFQTIDLCPLLLGTRGQLRGMKRPGGNIENGLSILPSDPASSSLGQDK